MIAFRSVLFAILFYANCLFWFVIALIGFVLPPRLYMIFPRGWSRSSLWIFEKVVGAKFEVRGRDRIPKEGCIVAAKHQSAWETMALLQFFDHPAFIYKRELNYVPLFGWHLMKSQQIPVDRGGKAAAIVKMLVKAKETLNAGRQILIFPEGTRRPVGAPPQYKSGVVRLYEKLDVPCLPVALNSGLAWPRRRFMKFPYTVIIEFLEPIPRGLTGQAFQAELQNRIETGTDALVAEALAEKGQSLSSIQASTES